MIGKRLSQKVEGAALFFIKYFAIPKKTLTFTQSLTKIKYFMGNRFKLINLFGGSIIVDLNYEIQERDYFWSQHSNNIYFADSINRYESHNEVEDFSHSIVFNSKYIFKIVYASYSLNLSGVPDIQLQDVL